MMHYEHVPYEQEYVLWTDWNRFTEFSLEPHWIVFMGLFLVGFGVYYFSTLKRRGVWLDKKVVTSMFFAFYLVMVTLFVFTPIRIFAADYREHVVREQMGREPFTQSEIMNIHLVPLMSIYRDVTMPIQSANEHGIDMYWNHYIFFLVRGIGGNLILLFPFAVFLGVLGGDFKDKKERRYWSWKRVILTGLLISMAIELMQLGINLATQLPNRQVMVDDLILNTIGFVAGYATWKKWPGLFEKPVEWICRFLMWGEKKRV